VKFEMSILTSSRDRRGSQS